LVQLAIVVYATVLSAVAFVGLALHELHFSAPILDLRILKLPIFDTAVAVTITFGVVLFGTLLLSPVFLQELLGYNAWQGGLVRAPRGIAAMISMMVVGNLARFGIDTRKFIALGFTLVAIGCWYSAMVMSFGFGMARAMAACLEGRGYTLK
jgi:DHA2 family multidrug resistance protein